MNCGSRYIHRQRYPTVGSRPMGTQKYREARDVCFNEWEHEVNFVSMCGSVYGDSKVYLLV